MSKILPNTFFSQYDYKSTQISYTIYFFVLSDHWDFFFKITLFWNWTNIYFLLFFDHQITKSTQISYASLLIFFCQITKRNFSSFSSVFTFSKFHFFWKFFKILHFFPPFWKLDNWKCSHLLAHWLFKKKCHYRRSAKRGLTKKENTRENAF